MLILFQHLRSNDHALNYSFEVDTYNFERNLGEYPILKAHQFYRLELLTNQQGLNNLYLTPEPEQWFTHLRLQTIFDEITDGFCEKDDEMVKLL